MKFNKIIFLLAIVGFTASCGEKGDKEKIHVVSTDVYKGLVDDDSVALIDVRTPEEFSEGTLSGAVNIDFFDEENFHDAYDEYDRKEPIYLFCRSGSRSMKVAEKLVEMGFEEIYDMEGGYMQWTKDNK